jgi:SPX domain
VLICLRLIPALRRDMSPSHLRSSISEYGDMTEAGLTWPRQPSQGPYSPSSALPERRRSSHGPRRRALSQIITDFIPGQRREASRSQPSLLPTSIWNSRSNYARDVRMVYKRRITTLYLTATSLRSYVELNRTGFRKILKKYDKTLESPVSAFIADESPDAYHCVSCNNATWTKRSNARIRS